MYEILEFLSTQVPEAPKAFGLFHIICLIVITTVTTLLCANAKKFTDKGYRKVVLIAYIIIVVAELYKQTIWTFSAHDGVIDIGYPWYIFPFQFCSNPYYIFPFIIFMKDSKLRDGFLVFACTFSLFAGLGVMALPDSVYCRYAGINVQTMIHHGTQVYIGIFTAVMNRDKLNIKNFLRCIGIFVCFVFVATIINEISYACVGPDGDPVNMFLISYHKECSLPVIGAFHQTKNGPIIPYILFLMLYIFGFAFVALLIEFIEWLILVYPKEKKFNFFDIKKEAI